MSAQSSSPDPARSLALLWGPKDRAGRSGLSLGAIIDAAIAVADAEGLPSIVMRRVATALDVGTMSLYSYIPGKHDLIALMVDQVYAELYPDGPPAQQATGWREGLTVVAQRNWDLALRHPWLLHVTSGRPSLGPGVIRKYDAELRPLDGIGLTDVEMDQVLTLVLTHVEGSARALTNQRASAHEAGMSDDEWWRLAGPILATVLRPDEVPVAARVGQATGEAYQAAGDPELAFRFGLARILDGVEALIASRAAP